MAIDRYGILVVLAFIVIFQNQFFKLLRWIIWGLAKVFSDQLLLHLTEKLPLARLH